ncbi:hypothetical protein Tco_0421732 [Tanacetum coccineum]
MKHLSLKSEDNQAYTRNAMLKLRPGRKIQDIDDDPLVSLVRESMKEKSTDFGVSKEKSTDKGKRYMRKASKKGTKGKEKLRYEEDNPAKRMAEEEALTEQQKKRKSQVQFEAQFYTEEDWDAIKAKLEANA